MNNIKHAIHELRSMFAYDEHSKRMINDWIKRNINESHYKVNKVLPGNKEHYDHEIKRAMIELGISIAKNSNMYPKWIETENGLELTVSAIYFKNEFGV